LRAEASPPAGGGATSRIRWRYCPFKRSGAGSISAAREHRTSQERAPRPAGDRPAPWSGLASKLILFVFASTFITATIVSWISIQSRADRCAA
jgi:hypothetical protein